MDVVLQASVMLKAEELRRTLHGASFSDSPGPSDEAVRFVLLGEICSVTGFQRDQLYVEYVVRYDPNIWAAEVRQFTIILCTMAETLQPAFGWHWVCLCCGLVLEVFPLSQGTSVGATLLRLDKTLSDALGSMQQHCLTVFALPKP